jgi:hypothetical protein
MVLVTLYPVNTSKKEVDCPSWWRASMRCILSPAHGRICHWSKVTGGSRLYSPLEEK